MTGTGKARKREQAIAALLEHPTIAAAASAVGIGEKTLRRWLAEREFQADYRAARERAVRMAVGRLQGLLSIGLAAPPVAPWSSSRCPGTGVRARPMYTRSFLESLGSKP